MRADWLGTELIKDQVAEVLLAAELCAQPNTWRQTLPKLLHVSRLAPAQRVVRVYR
jgi:hypothetical protein